MNNYEFRNPKTHTNYVRISKQKAKKLFEAGHTVVIAPCRLRLFTTWGGWHLMNKANSVYPELEFTKIVNTFVYYNCNNELGTYPSFYVTENLA